MATGQSGNNDINGMPRLHTSKFPFLIFRSSWVMLYNSNLDRSLANRKSKAELRKDLKKWEDEMSKKKKTVIHDVREYQVR